MKRRLMVSLRQLLVERRATATTEFVISLPVFLIMFSGILKLGALHRKSVQTEVSAHKKTFRKALEVQELDISQGLTGSGSLSGSAIHMSPATAAADATTQVERFEPRQTGLAKSAIKVVEHSTYSYEGMALSGHFGEAYSRTQPLQLVGMRLLGVNDAVDANPEPLLGESYLARDLVYDGPDAVFDANDNSGVNNNSTLQSLVDYLNSAVDTVGARGALAANIRYGTVTGLQEDSLDVGTSVDYRSHYTVTVPPFASQDPWDDQMMAVVVSRLTMANSDYPVYTGVLGFTGTPQINEGSGPLEVPKLNEVPLTTPLNYDANTY